MQLARPQRLLEVDEYREFELPPRSKLYHIPPIAVGTPDCESFSSYVARLAAAHCLTPVNLLRWILSTSLEGTGSSLSNAVIKHKMEALYLVNGFGPITESWVSLISGLTMRKDICQTTFLRYEELFSPLGMRREFRAWCPLCLTHWQSSGAPVYEPLQWFIRPITICPTHSIHLETTCPSCGATKLPLIGWRSMPGYCSRCSAWLGKEQSTTVTMISDYERWTAQAINELIAYAPDHPIIPKASIKEMIRTGVQMHCSGNVAQFAKLIKKSKTTIWTWVNEDFCLPFSDVINLCHRLDLSPLEFITGDKSCWTKAKTPADSGYPRLKDRKTHSKEIDWPAVLTYLTTVKNGLGQPAPSLAQVADHLSLTVTGLRSRYPEICREIAGNYKAALSRKAEAKQAQIEARIKKAMMEMIQEGIVPTRRQVTTKLGELHLLRRKTNFVIWQRLYKELCGVSPS